MVKSSSLRILLFSGAVVALVFGGVSFHDSQARPLWDLYINLTVSASLTDYARVGEEIAYTYEVRNTAGYQLFNVDVADSQAEVVCPSTEIELDGQMTCTGTHVITQADIQRGFLTNEARVEGTFKVESGRSAGCCGGTSYDYYDVSAEDSLTISGPMYSIYLTKTGRPATFSWPGELIVYTYTVENTGTGLLEGPIAIQDNLVQVSCPDGGLELGEIMECTGSYTTTLADVEARAIRNTAVANAGHDTTAIDDFEVLLEPSPDLQLAISVAPATYSLYWQLITYTLTVTNAGNVAIEGPFQIIDPMLDEWTCPRSATLGLGESLTCLGYYRTRNPLGRAISNCATVEGNFEAEPVATNEACTQVTYIAAAGPPTPTPIEVIPTPTEVPH